MNQKIGRFTLLVHNYEEAIHFYVDKMGFQIITDQQAPSNRFVHLGCNGQFPVGVWLWEAEEESKHLVGNQAGNHPLLIMYTDDCISDYFRLKDRGVEFINEPEQTTTEIYVHAMDLYGNIIVMVEMLNTVQ